MSAKPEQLRAKANLCRRAAQMRDTAGSYLVDRLLLVLAINLEEEAAKLENLARHPDITREP